MTMMHQLDHDRAVARATGEAFVFRDFEKSRLMSIREAVHAQPYHYGALFLAMVVFWTVVMSAGEGMEGASRPALSLTPHVATYALVLGLLMYPLRQLWIPLGVYGAAFAYVFVQPFGASVPWIAIPSLRAWHFVALLLIGLAFSLGLGVVYRLIFRWLFLRFRPFAVDISFTMAAAVTFVLVCLLQLWVMLRFAAQLDPQVASDLGFTATYLQFSLLRIMRGGVVITAFLLAAINMPRQKDLRLALLLAMFFPLLGLAQSHGFQIYPMIDVVLLGLLIAVLMPPSISIFACIMGITLYAGLTGQFLHDTVEGDIHEVILRTYSVIGLYVLVMIFTLRMYGEQKAAHMHSSIRKLDRVRNAAGVGLFAINLTMRRYLVDDAAARLTGCAPEGELDAVIEAFDPMHHEPLVGGMASKHGEGTGHTFKLRARGDDGLSRIVQLYIWYERAPSGDDIAYGLLLDISAEHRRKKQLTEALNTLNAQQERQRQLFSIVSHELRTPASIISMLIDDLTDVSDRARAQRQLRDAADQLLAVMDDMRQAVNPEKNLPIRLEPYVPAEVAESIRNGMQLAASERGIAVDIVLGPGAERHRMGDMRRVKQVLTNLVRNAINQSNGTRVTIRYDVDPAHVTGDIPQSHWRVEDDGIGIPDEDVERLFQPFERGGNDARKQADGSGLGLFIVRSAIELLGGRVSFYRPTSGGTGYSVHLPEPEAQASGAPAASAAAPALQRRLRVLLAEDNALVADVMRARLEKHVGPVTHAANGREALDLALQMQPDLLITDLFMPEIDGDELIRTLRERGYTRPIIGISAAVVGHDLDRFRAAGASAIMQKPLDTQQLKQCLEQLLRKDAAG